MNVVYGDATPGTGLGTGTPTPEIHNNMKAIQLLIFGSVLFYGCYHFDDNIHRKSSPDGYFSRDELYRKNSAMYKYCNFDCFKDVLSEESDFMNNFSYLIAEIMAYQVENIRLTELIVALQKTDNPIINVDFAHDDQNDFLHTLHLRKKLQREIIDDLSALSKLYKINIRNNFQEGQQIGTLTQNDTQTTLNNVMKRVLHLKGYLMNYFYLNKQITSDERINLIKRIHYNEDVSTLKLID